MLLERDAELIELRERIEKQKAEISLQDEALQEMGTAEERAQKAIAEKALVCLNIGCWGDNLIGVCVCFLKKYH